MARRPEERGRHRARIRARIAEEAARLMYREGVSQYLDAKQIAARRLLGREARGAHHRPGSLPTNGEIREALLRLVALSEGKQRDRRLFAMRIVALTWMHQLQPWHPRLIGSVWSGHARRGSDIDLHVFAEQLGALEHDLRGSGWRFTSEEVLIRMGDVFRTYRHLHGHSHGFPVELSVYPPSDRRVVTRSSTDGRAIDRVSAARLARRIAEEHPEGWQRWREAGGLDADLDALDLFEDPDDAPGAFDGLLAELRSPSD